MRLRILAVPNCPNVALLQARLAEVLTGRDDVEVAVEVIDTVEAAAQAGMPGSPTLLVDGVDPFAAPDIRASMSCRLYRDDSGRSTGVPSVAQICAALASGGDGTASSGGVSGLALNKATGAAGLSRPARQVHLWVLRAFTDSGRPPRRGFS